MTTFEAHVLEMLIRVRQFGLTHAGKFPTGSAGAALLAIVAATITAMEGHSADQAQHKRAARQQTRQKTMQRRALLEAMKAISRTARAMSRTISGLADKFLLPEDQREQNLLAVARSFASDAEPLKADFIKSGMTPTFLDDFKALIAAVEQTVDSRAQKSAAAVAATVSVGEAAETGRVAVRDLDAVVHNVFADDPAALAEWESASHIERPPQRATKGTPSNEPPPTNS